MARPGKGILDGFSGKVGTVVGATWNGIPVMRSRPARNKNRKVSVKQEVQQAKFSLAASFLRTFTSLLESSFQRIPGQTGRNSAVSNMLTQAIGGIYPNLAIDFSMVQVAKGSLKKAANPVATSTEPGKLRFSWTDNTGLGNASTQDKAILVAYCEELNDVLFTVDGAERATGASLLDVPYFSGKQAHTWISFHSPDGQKIADSTYTGVVVIA